MKNKCKNHPDREAISFCHVCKEYYCKECLQEGREFYYCRKRECSLLYNVEVEIRRESYEENPRFCPNCINDTLAEPVGNVNTLNGIGTSINSIGSFGFTTTCPICRSTIMKKVYTVFGIQTKLYGYYRIIYLDHGSIFSNYKGSYISRKLKCQDFMPVSTKKE